MLVRDAVEGDLPGILEIHNEAIANSTAIWDEEPSDLGDRRRWFDDRRGAGFPILVADVDGRIAGYASYGVWRARTGSPSRTRCTCTSTITVAELPQP